MQLTTSLLWEFNDHLICLINQQRQEQPILFDVEQMSQVGKSKVRHVGGWAIRKVLSRARKYIQRNVYTQSCSTLASVKTNQMMCELLEENIIQPYAELEESSSFPKTLEVIEGRQYRDRGLLHISDQAYLFFLELEKKRVAVLNKQILKRAREDTVELALTELQDDKELKQGWLSCFEDMDADKNKVFFFSEDLL